jgi:hypothetical protein
MQERRRHEGTDPDEPLTNLPGQQKKLKKKRWEHGCLWGFCGTCRHS